MMGILYPRIEESLYSLADLLLYSWLIPCELESSVLEFEVIVFYF